MSRLLVTFLPFLQMSDPDGSMGRLASVQDELESMVECPVHFGVLVQPKSLPCGHVICLDCIRRWVEARRGILVCPECNNEQILPRGGVEELPNSYRLMKLCEYLGNLNIVASALEGDAQANTAAPPVMRCDDHVELPLDRICRDCRQPVCQECMRTQHAGHLCLDGSTFLRHMDRPLKKLQDQAKMKQREAERCLVELKKMKVQLNVSRESANSAIDHYVMRLMEKATQAGDSLKNQVEAMYHGKVRMLENQESSLDGIIYEIDGAVQSVHDQPGNLQQNLASLPPLVDDTSKRLKDVEKITVPSAPVVSSDIWVEMNEGIFDWFKPQGKKEIGQVVTSEVACPSECVVEIVSKRPTLPFEEVVVVLAINDGHGSQVNVQDINFISAEVVKANGNKVQQVFEMCGNGKFVTSFTPQSIGKYLLIVKAYNQKVKNSPLKILVKPRGKSTVDLKGHPTFSAIHDVLKVGDNYLVLDSDNVNMVDKEGRLVNKFVIKDKVFQPYAVACHNQAYYVTALKGKKVVKFSRTGLPLLEIGHGILQAPTGIAVAKDGTIYVADDKKSCIYVFRSDGQLCHLLSGPGSDREQISHPWYIKFNTHGHLVVADCGNQRIQVFDPQSGKHLKSIYVDHNGRPLGCRGLDVDVNDNIFVTARQPGGGDQFECVKVYSPDGDLLGSFAESPAKKGLHFVRGINVVGGESKSTALVANGGTSSIKFYII